MFDIGWSEMAIMALVALIVIGPRELPHVLRTIGRWVGKARAMAREFQGSFDDMVRDSELDKAGKEFNSLRKVDLGQEIGNVIDPAAGTPATGTERPNEKGAPSGESGRGKAEG